MKKLIKFAKRQNPISRYPLNDKKIQEEREKITAERERLNSDIALFNDTLHEVRKINNQLKSSALQLSNALKGIYIDDLEDEKVIKNIRKNIEANTNLLSIRMDAYDMLLNPDSIGEEMEVPIDIYRKVEKLYKCLYAKRIEKCLNVELIGHTDRKYRLTNTIELGFFIIFENAIKYSPNGDNITAEFFECEDQLEVVFTNWGIRPLDNEIPKIKERGFRSERVIKETTIEGSGLGLYLLEQICDSNDVELRILIGNGSKRVNGITYAPFVVRLLFK